MDRNPITYPGQFVKATFQFATDARVEPDDVTAYFVRNHEPGNLVELDDVNIEDQLWLQGDVYKSNESRVWEVEVEALIEKENVPGDYGCAEIEVTFPGNQTVSMRGPNSKILVRHESITVTQVLWEWPDQRI